VPQLGFAMRNERRGGEESTPEPSAPIFGDAQPRTLRIPSETYRPTPPAPIIKSKPQANARSSGTAR